MDKFEVIRLIGEGGYGVVYKCKSRDTDDFVAIKKIKHSINADPKKIGLREIRVLSALRHVNVNQLIGAFKSKDRLFLVLEFVERTLLDLLNESPKGILAQRYRSYTYQLSCSLQYCHSKNIVHRDVKPENLLITEYDVLKLCDFGFARFLPGVKANLSMFSDDDTDPVHAEHRGYHQLTLYVATRWYRPPELLLRMPYGKPVDIWAIGCILVEMATGEPLFCGDTDLDQLFQIRRTIGTFTSDQLDAMLASPKYQIVSTEQSPHTMSSKEKLQRFHSVLGDEMFEVLRKCILNDPSERISADDCANHPSFELERRTIIPQMTTYSKLSRLLNPRVSARRNRTWDLTKILSSSENSDESNPSTVPNSPKTGQSVSMSKEEEMLVGAEADLEREREHEHSETPYLLVKKHLQLKEIKANVTNYYKIRRKLTPNMKKKHNDEAISDDGLPDINATGRPKKVAPEIDPINPYSLQRSSTWFQAPPIPEREKALAFLNKYNSKKQPDERISFTAKRKTRLAALTGVTRQTINTYVTKTSGVVKWDGIKKDNDLVTSSNARDLGLAIRHYPNKLPSTTSHGNDFRLPEFR